MACERLDKVIAAQGMLSRGDVKKMVWEKRVLINGVYPRTFGDKIDPEKDRVQIDGREISLKKHVYLMLNKPKGVVSAANDPKEKTVVDLVPPSLLRKGLFPAGRLDKDTTGFVLITDDGDFAHRILAPKSHVSKTYEALIEGRVTEEMTALFERGIPIGKGDVCRPAKLRVIEPGVNDRVEVVITEGMYHQIKRMFEACGSKVLSLVRTRMGSLALDASLRPGECRELTVEEINKLLGNTNK